MVYDPTDNWSYSSLACIQRCAHQWYLKYIKRDWRPGPAFFKRGNTVHKVAERSHKAQMIDMALKDGTYFERVKPQGINEPKQLFLDGMEELPGTEKALEEAKDVAADYFDKHWTERGGVKIEKGDDEKVVKATTREASIDMSGFYVNDVAPPIVPLGVEKEVRMSSAKLPNGVVLKGIIDLITDDDGQEIIRDLKTAEKRPFGDPDGKNPENHHADAEQSMQLSVYHLMRYADWKNRTGEGRMPKAGMLSTLVRTPKKHEMALVTQTTTTDVTDLQILMSPPRLGSSSRPTRAATARPASFATSTMERANTSGREVSNDNLCVVRKRHPRRTGSLVLDVLRRHRLREGWVRSR